MSMGLGGCVTIALMSLLLDGPRVAGARLRPWNSPLGIFDSAFTARSQPMMAETQGRVVIFGGRSGSLSEVKTIGQLEMFDPSTNSWAQLHKTATGQEPFPRIAGGMATIDGRVLVFGGKAGDASPCLGDFYIFDLDGNSWTNLTASDSEQPSARCHPGMAHLAVAGEKVYLFGGFSDGKMLLDLFSFDLRSFAWSTLPSMPAAFAAPAPELPCSTAASSSKLLVWCGATRSLFSYNPDGAGAWADETASATGSVPPALVQMSASWVARQALVVSGDQAFVIGSSQTAEYAQPRISALSSQDILIDCNQNDDLNGTHIVCYKTVRTFEYTFHMLQMSSNAWSELDFQSVMAPLSVFDFGVVVARQRIYMFGGAVWSNDKELSWPALVSFAPATRAWSTFGSLFPPERTSLQPPELHSHEMVALGAERVLVLGGKHPALTMDHGVEEQYFAYGMWDYYAYGDPRMAGNAISMFVYDTAANAWHEETPQGDPPSNRFRHSTAVVGDLVFVFGGSHNPTAPADIVAPSAQVPGAALGLDTYLLDDMYALNTSSMLWSQVVSSGPVPSYRGMGTMVAAGSELFLFGGYKYFEILGDFWVFSVDSYEWTELTDLSTPSARLDHGMAAMGGKVYVYGGLDADFETSLADMHCFDVARRTWSELVPHSAPRFHLAAAGIRLVVAAGRLYRFGGFDQETVLLPGTAAVIYEFDFDEQRWRKEEHLGNAPAYPFNTAIAVLGERAFAFGGCVACEASYGISAGAQRLNFIYALPLAQEVVATHLGVDILRSYDTDTLVVPSNAALRLPAQLTLGRNGAPTRLRIRGEDGGSSDGVSIVQSGNGSLSCFALHGCASMHLQRLRIVCSSDAAAAARRVMPPIQLGGEGAHGRLSEVSVSGCASALEGGAVRVLPQAVLEVHASAFSRCASAVSGGAINVRGGVLRVSATRFEGCSAAETGGAIAASEAVVFTEKDSYVSGHAANAHVDIDSTVFLANSARAGGAMHLQLAADSLVSASTFVDNRATAGDGGAVLMVSSALSFSGANFSNNSAVGGGGALFWSSSAPLIRRSDGSSAAAGSPDALCPDASAVANAATYGSCLASNASDIRVRAVVAGAGGQPERVSVAIEAWDGAASPGLEFELRVQLLDAYGQVIRSDSDTELRPRALEGAGGVRLEGEGKAVTLRAGEATLTLFAIVPYPLDLQPASSASSSAAYAIAATEAVLRVEADMEGGAAVRSASFPVRFGAGNAVCPAGYFLAFSAPSAARVAEAQCVRCSFGQYAMQALAGPSPPAPGCFRCPEGAVCLGGDDFTPVVYTSSFHPAEPGRWALQPDGWFELVGCPIGHELLGVSRVGRSEQRCEPCLPGFFVDRDRDPTMGCQPCPSNARCLGGAPPEFDLVVARLDVSVSGVAVAELAGDAALTSLRSAVAALFNVDAADVSLDSSCVAGGAACALSRRAAASKIVFDVTVTQAESAGIVDGSQSAAVAASLEAELGRLGLLPAAVQVLARNETTSRFPPGEVWEPGPGGRYFLVACPPGHLLINTTADLQECKKCKAGTYTLSAYDRCKDHSGKGVQCHARGCHACPSGGSCPDGSQVEFRVPGTEVVETTAPGHSHTSRFQRISACPAGHHLVFYPTEPSLDDCVPCNPRSYSAQRALSPLLPRPGGYPDISQNATRLGLPVCLACPKGAICDGAAQVLADKGHWRGDDMACKIHATELDPHACEALGSERRRSGALGDEAEAGGVVRRAGVEAEATRTTARVYRCRAGMCLGANACREGHRGIACALCLDDWAMQGGLCVRCASDSDADKKSRLAATVIAPVFAAIAGAVLWYLFAWKPLLSAGPGGSEGKAMACVVGCIALPVTQMLKQLVAAFKNELQYLQGVFKILTSFAQILGSFLFTFEIEWPDIISNLMSAANLLRFSIGSLPSTGCMLQHATALQKLAGETLFPLIILFLLAFPSIYVLLAGGRRHPKYEPVVNRFFQSAMITLFLVYPSTSAVVLRSFNCVCYDEMGCYLQHDHGVDCASQEYTSLWWWALAMVFVYPIGVPAIMYFAMRRARIPELCAQKQAVARFKGMLLLRKHQLSTMARSLVANAIGWTRDDAEFKRRIAVVHSHGLGELFVGGGNQSGGRRPVLRPRQMRRAIAVIAGTEERTIPAADVKELVDKYDVDKSGGLDEREFEGLVKDLVEEHLMFTGFERLEELGMKQLRTLKEHDWSLPVRSFQNDDDIEEEEEVEDPVIEAEAEEEERKENGGEDGGEGREEEKERKEMMQWIAAKGKALQAANKLSLEPLVWKDDGTPDERKAIMRLGFLFLAYKVDVWWFEVLGMINKCLVTSILVFAYPGSPSQVAVGFLMNFMFLLVVLIKRPLTNAQLMQLQIFSLVAHCFTLFFGVMTITAAYVASQGGGSKALPVLLFVLNIGVVILPLLQLAANAKAIVLRYKGLSARLTRMQNVKLDAAKDLAKADSFRSAPSASQRALKLTSVKPVDNEASVDDAIAAPATPSDGWAGIPGARAAPHTPEPARVDGAQEDMESVAQEDMESIAERFGAGVAASGDELPRAVSEGGLPQPARDAEEPPAANATGWVTFATPAQDKAGAGGAVGWTASQRSGLGATQVPMVPVTELSESHVESTRMWA